MMKSATITQRILGERIQKLRQEHGYSQEELAVSLGVSRQAIGQIEKGERSIGALEIAAVAKILGVSVDWIMRSEQASEKSKMQYMTRELHFAFEKEKFRQAILYVLSICGGKANIGETVLYKLLYFIDFNAFELLGKPVTGMQYVKMQFGPVPHQTKYRETIKEMVEKNELKIFTQEYFGMSQKRYVALVDPHVDVFNVREKEIIDQVLRQLADFSARKIADYAHGDAPWALAEDGELIDYASVVDRTAPYTQVDHWAGWMSAGAEDVLKHLPPLTEEERDYYEKLRP